MYYTALKESRTFLLSPIKAEVLRLTKNVCNFFLSIITYKVPMTFCKTICSPWHLSIFRAEKGRALHDWQDNRF